MLRFSHRQLLGENHTDAVGLHREGTTDSEFDRRVTVMGWYCRTALTYGKKQGLFTASRNRSGVNLARGFALTKKWESPTPSKVET
jgi:hypothetical protein